MEKQYQVAEAPKITSSRIVVAILYLKVTLNKDYYRKFHRELSEIFSRYQNEFVTVNYDDILQVMGIDIKELDKLI